MNGNVLIKTSKVVSEDKEKVSVISYQYESSDVSQGFEVSESSIPLRQGVDTHRAELFFNPVTNELFYKYEVKTQEELDKEVL